MGRKRRLLALAVHPVRSPATRFRVEALRDALAERDIELTLATSIDEPALDTLYSREPIAKKAAFAARSLLAQWKKSLADGPWDAVFVQREAALVGPPVLEWLLHSVRGLPMIFDFDDAIWLPTGSASQNPLAARILKMPSKTWWLMRRAAHVFAGSEYLAEVARQHNPNVTVIPTVVSREKWTPLPGRLDGELVHPDNPVIGFIGTHSTAQYLHLVVPALQRLRAEGRQFRFRVVGAGPDLDLPIAWENVPWSQEREIDLFRELDIGIAPLPDNEWTRGKCAFKQIQYLAVGVPCVTSPVGAANELLTCRLALGAANTNDWYKTLTDLLSDRPLRSDLARRARAHTEAILCLEAQGFLAATTLEDALRRQNTDTHSKRRKARPGLQTTARP